MDRLAPPNFPRDVSRLIGKPIPAIDLATTSGELLNLSTASGTTVVFVQPGSSSAISPVDGWVDRIKKIPGAAGCTGQCKAFENAQDAFRELGVRVVGLSGQTQSELTAVREKLALSYELASDSDARFLAALGMRSVPYAAPNGFGEKPYHPRLILVVKNGIIADAMVPDLTPEGAVNSAQQILEKLRTN